MISIRRGKADKSSSVRRLFSGQTQNIFAVLFATSSDKLFSLPLLQSPVERLGCCVCLLLSSHVVSLKPAHYARRRGLEAADRPSASALFVCTEKKKKKGTLLWDVHFPLFFNTGVYSEEAHKRGKD